MGGIDVDGVVSGGRVEEERVQDEVSELAKAVARVDTASCDFFRSKKKKES